MNRAISHLAARRVLPQAAEKERFLKSGSGRREITSEECLVLGDVALLRGREGPFHLLTPSC